MVFSSYEFIFLFLPLTVVGYYWLSLAKSSCWQHLFLVAASLFFYAYFNLSYLAIMLTSIVVNYTLAQGIRKWSATNQLAGRKLLLGLGVLFNLGLLGYFKYYDFFIGNINAAFSTSFALKHILLPLGISFFTFQQFSFLFSNYHQESKAETFIEYCLFVTFFPQLVAGPIVLYDEMMPQFQSPDRRRPNFDSISKGTYVFVLGLFKKVVIADTVALFADNGFASGGYNSVGAWATVLSYALQIYFDFSGYSDMAIGLGLMFNIDIPKNFVSPYKSASITEFWRRWHITLGRALSSYVYVPLGGNRKGKARTYLNLFLTFLVSGLWHGAAWTFVLWGMLHGILVIIERYLGAKPGIVPRPIRVGITFLLVSLLWVLFRAENLSQAFLLYRNLFDFDAMSIQVLADLVTDGIVNFPQLLDIAYLSTILVSLLLTVFLCANTLEKSETFKPNTQNLIFVAVVFCISLIHLSRQSVFIYFNF